MLKLSQIIIPINSIKIITCIARIPLAVQNHPTDSVKNLSGVFFTYLVLQYIFPAHRPVREEVKSRYL